MMFGAAPFGDLPFGAAPADALAAGRARSAMVARMPHLIAVDHEPLGIRVAAKAQTVTVPKQPRVIRVRP